MFQEYKDKYVPSIASGERCGGAPASGKPTGGRRERLMDGSGKVRELTEVDIARFRPIQEVDPSMLEAVSEFRRRGRPPIDSPKVRIGFRLAPEVVEGIRATGRGYNARVERVLRDALMEGKL